MYVVHCRSGKFPTLAADVHTFLRVIDPDRVSQTIGRARRDCSGSLQICTVLSNRRIDVRENHEVQGSVR